jgi:hypothetical protein
MVSALESVNFRCRPIHLRPVYIGLLSALIVVVFHESFDFSLQVPANAVMLIVLAGLALRMAAAAANQLIGGPVCGQFRERP